MLREKVLQELRNIRFPYNTERRNVLQPGQSKYQGFVLGLINPRGSGLKRGKEPRDSLRTHRIKYRQLYNLSNMLMKEINPEFEFTSIQYNKNQQCAKHKDSRNVNDSYILGLGDYTGGELRVYSPDELTFTDHDIKNNPLRFDGSTMSHETLPFEGERYTLVFYPIVKKNKSK